MANNKIEITGLRKRWLVSSLQPPDVHIHDLQLPEVVPAPDHVQNLLPG